MEDCRPRRGKGRSSTWRRFSRRWKSNAASVAAPKFVVVHTKLPMYVCICKSFLYVLAITRIIFSKKRVRTPRTMPFAEAETTLAATISAAAGPKPHPRENRASWRLLRRFKDFQSLARRLNHLQAALLKIRTQRALSPRGDLCHPEARVLCEPKDLWTRPQRLYRPGQIAQVLRFAQDDNRWRTLTYERPHARNRGRLSQHDSSPDAAKILTESTPITC